MDHGFILRRKRRGIQPEEMKEQAEGDENNKKAGPS